MTVVTAFSSRARFPQALFLLPVAVFVVLSVSTLRAEAQLPSSKGRVVILGFDGVEPTLVETMFAAGELPNLKKLSEQGTFKPLETANPPQSPTAWSSFITCKNPGEHGVYDFLRRNPKTYFPGVGFGMPEHATLSPDGKLLTPPVFNSIRHGESFWSVADKQGARSKILLVPFAYPVESLEQGHMICGLGVPDIRGTTSTFFAISTRELSIKSGGMALRLTLTDGAGSVEIPGARDKREEFDSAKAFVKVPLMINADVAGGNVTLTVQGQSVELAEGQWSKWVEWAFELSPVYKVRAVSQFYALKVAPEDVTVYMSCLQFHPDEQYIPFTTPISYGTELRKRYGLFKTIGWAYDTHALRQDALSDEAFLMDTRNSAGWQEQLTLDELDTNAFDMMVAAWTAPDRVSHMFWRYRDKRHPLYTEEGATKYGRAVEESYQKMDSIVGEVMKRLKENDLLFIMSDHGFHSFHTGFNVNTWLIRNGYLVVKGQTDAASGFTNEDYLQGFDWTRSKAYSIGLGSIFLNLKGREGKGLVDPAQADALIEEIRGKLLEVTHPEKGEKVFRSVYTRKDYHGGAMAEAPDIQLGYAEGFQSTKSAANGAAPKVLFEPNDDKWSGEHASSDVAFTPGIFFCNRPIAVDKPNIMDLGVTSLKYLGLAVPADFEGTDLLAAN
ncbi:MAG: hypothetical protein AMXMBFR84_28760 [Candidatus Hydrogenedentota bacterium]